jgi:hypothetical protein
MNTHDLILKLEIVISKLGINPGQAKQATGQYTISKDQNVQIFMDAFEENEHTFFQILSPIMQIPDTNAEALMIQLLKENHGLVDASFAIIDNAIFIKHTTEDKGQMTEDRIMESIQRIAYYNELFQKKFELTEKEETPS